MAACSKDNYTSTPKLTFKSVNGTVFPQSANIDFKLEVTDKEGDIQDTMWFEKNSFSCGADGYILSPNRVPNFTSRKDLKAEINVNLFIGAGGIPSCSDRDDSCYFRFWIKDKAGHTSDTVQSPTIKILKG